MAFSQAHSTRAHWLGHVNPSGCLSVGGGAVSVADYSLFEGKSPNSSSKINLELTSDGTETVMCNIQSHHIQTKKMGELQLKQCQRCAEEIANYIKAGRARTRRGFWCPETILVEVVSNLGLVIKRGWKHLCTWRLQGEKHQGFPIAMLPKST